MTFNLLAGDPFLPRPFGQALRHIFKEIDHDKSMQVGMLWSAAHSEWVNGQNLITILCHPYVVGGFSSIFHPLWDVEMSLKPPMSHAVLMCHVEHKSLWKYTRTELLSFEVTLGELQEALSAKKLWPDALRCNRFKPVQPGNRLKNPETTTYCRSGASNLEARMQNRSKSYVKWGLLRKLKSTLTCHRSICF